MSDLDWLLIVNDAEEMLCEHDRIPLEQARAQVHRPDRIAAARQAFADGDDRNVVIRILLGLPT
jgi:hypothetical protein